MELSARWPIKSLCRAMSISRPSYYKWKARPTSPSDRLRKRMANVALFSEYHAKYPSHDYHWLNAKKRLDLGVMMSDQYAYRCRGFAGVKSESRHYAYKKPREPKKVYPNAIMASINVFWAGGKY